MDEAAFLVLLMKKPKAAKPSPAAAAPAPAAAPADAKPAETTAEAAPAAEAEPAAAEAETKPSDEAPAAEAAAPAPAAPAEAEEPPEAAVDQLVAMGFEKEQVRACLRLARNNVEVAAAMLMDPELQAAAMQPGALSQGGGLDDLPANPIPGGQGGMVPGQLTEEQVVQMMEAQPQVFQQMLQQLVQQHPELQQLMQQDPQQLVRLITHVLNSSMQARGGAPGMPGMPGMPGGAGGENIFHRFFVANLI